MKKMTLSQIINMNIGFLGIQYSFGLQQTAINPIYLYLNAEPENLPWLNLAGPMTGLIVQPIIGAWSDNTWSNKWGRRKPFFLIGAILCSLCLFLFPFSQSLWMAVGLLWILDVGNNTTMEPYRAFIADKLDTSQQAQGFLMQSLFTGLGITLANFSIPFFQYIWANTSSQNIPQWVYGSFFIGAIISITTILISIFFIKEDKPHPEQLLKIQSHKTTIYIVCKDIFIAIKTMPPILWQLALVYLFQWYAMFIYWEFISLNIVQNIFNSSPENKLLYNEAVSWTGVLNGTYNIITFLVALLLARLVNIKGAKFVHVFSLTLAAIGLISLSFIKIKWLTLLPIIGLGVGWASIMGVPYLIVVKQIPKEKYGVYMGIINMMIVIPMIIQTMSFKYIYKYILNLNASSAMLMAGVMLGIAAFLTSRLKNK